MVDPSSLRGERSVDIERLTIDEESMVDQVATYVWERQMCEAIISVESRMCGEPHMGGKAHMCGETHMCGEAHTGMCGEAHMCGESLRHTYVCGGTYVWGNTYVWGGNTYVPPHTSFL